MKASRSLRLLFALAAVGVVGFLALRSSPWVGELPWIPHWLSDWADRHGTLRNLPAFAALTVALIPAFGWRLGGGIAAGLSVALELAQVFIAGRTFDWADIGWSLAGVAAVSAVAWYRQPHPSRRLVQNGPEP